MKVFLVVIGIVITIAVITSISLLAIHDNLSHCTFCPEQHVPNQSPPTSVTTNPHSTTIIIPSDSEDADSGKNYEPNIAIVVLGVNNTVQWINESIFGNTIEADNHDDPNFWNATYFPNGGIIKSGQSFNYTFTQVGEFGYHGAPHPWLRGQVLVLPQSSKNLTQTVIMNDTKIPGPCETFELPCPLNVDRTFTAQKFGLNIYIEKVTINGIDHYAIIHPTSSCEYPSGHSTCTNPDDIELLRIAGANILSFVPLNLSSG